MTVIAERLMSPVMNLTNEGERDEVKAADRRSRRWQRRYPAAVARMGEQCGATGIPATPHRAADDAPCQGCGRNRAC